MKISVNAKIRQDGAVAAIIATVYPVACWWSLTGRWVAGMILMFFIVCALLLMYRPGKSP